jgi:hypothetical protein
MLNKFWSKVLLFFFYICIKLKIMGAFESYIERFFRDGLKYEKLHADNVNVVIIKEAEFEGTLIPLSFLITISFVKEKEINDILIKYDIKRSSFPTNYPHELIEIPTGLKIVNLNRTEMLEFSTTIEKIVKHTQPTIQKEYNKLFR